MFDSVGHGERAQSELLGIVLLFALVLTVSLTVVVAGGTALSDVRSDTTTESAELTMSEFQSAAASVAAEDAASQRIEFARTTGASSANDQVSGSDAEANSGTAGNVQVDDSAGEITITVEDTSNPAGPQTVVDEELGTIYYEDDGEKIAYQGGGIFRQNTGTDSSALLSPPDFQYQYGNGNPTLRLPLRTIEESPGSEASLDDGFTISKAPSALQPSNPTAIPSQLKNGDWIEISVTSEYYRAWGTLFESRTGGTVTYPGSNTVTLRLEAPTAQGPVQGPVLATGPSVDLRNQINVDSYDSRVGPYASQTPGDATVYADGDITIQGGGQINGDLQSTGDVVLKGHNLAVTGTVYHDGTLTASSGNYGSEVGHTTSIPSVQNRDGMITSKVSEIAGDNDNTRNPAVSAIVTDLETGGCSSTCTLPAGDYHFNDLIVEGTGGSGQLALDTSGGDINIAVENSLEVETQAELKVEGSGTVNIYNEGDLTIESNKNTKVWNPAQDATQLWAWQHSSTDTEIGTASTFTGVVHAGPSGNIEIGTNKKGDIYGALIGDVGTAGAGRPIHYDQALRTANPFGSSSTDDSTVSFVQIDLSGVEVTD